MKKSKMFLIAGLSLFMFQSVSYADNHIPEQVFQGLSAVIDTIETGDNSNTGAGTDTAPPIVASSEFKDKVIYNRDRNSGKLTLKMSGLRNSDIKENSGVITVSISQETMAQNTLVGPITFMADKNDRLVQSFEFINEGSSGYFNIYLMDNVDYNINATNNSVDIDFIKKTPAVPKIVIDPGHGGKDPGATSKTTQTQEKALALRTGLLLRDSLVSKGYDVTMTRDSDWYPALTDRSAQANMMDADAFISIHYNSAGATSASGIETFAYATEDNKRLASSIQAQLIANTGAANRGVKNGNKLIVLNTTKVPAVLLELGFLSNPTEAKRMLENDYQNTLAESIAKGVDIYFGR